MEEFINLETARLKKIISDKEVLLSHLESLKGTLADSNKNLTSAKEALTILQVVARETQGELEEHISSVVTMALAAVEVIDPEIPKPPEFLARAVERRNTIELDLLFKEGDREQDPLGCSGYGYVDIADYALRIQFIILESEYQPDEISRTLILDEPFRNVDPKLQYKVSEMLKMVSDDLGFQQIIVSHGEGINKNADNLFSVKKIGQVSEVKNEKSRADI